jgi:MFS family permease
MNSHSNKFTQGLKQNAGQFSLLIIINAFVGAMVGLERTILPEIAEQDFNLSAKSAVLSYIVVFGIVKAITNWFAGRLSDRIGRRKVLIWGWISAIPVPFLLMWANHWNLILLANVFLGVSQGLTWSTTVIMKIDLVGSKNRGLAMGLNEFAGYIAVAASALATGYIAKHWGLRPEPFLLGIAYVIFGLALSIFWARETQGFAQQETISSVPLLNQLTAREIFLQTSFKHADLSSVTQVGFFNNFNDGMAWGLFPLLFAAWGISIDKIGLLAAIYLATWGVTQLFTGGISDFLGRKWLIVTGMWIQAGGIGITAFSTSFIGFTAGSILLGVGTAMVYPTLLAAIGDVAQAYWRATAVGTYRFWRDIGYAFGAIVSGVVADFFGLTSAIYLTAAITFLSGSMAAFRMRETLLQKKALTQR